MSRHYLNNSILAVSGDVLFRSFPFSWPRRSLWTPGPPWTRSRPPMSRRWIVIGPMTSICAVGMVSAKMTNQRSFVLAIALDAQHTTGPGAYRNRGTRSQLKAELTGLVSPAPITDPGLCYLYIFRVHLDADGLDTF